MGNQIIQNPKGIDKTIQPIQTDLFNKLDWGNIDVFGRVYRNQSKEKGIIPEAFIGESDYVDVYMDDTVNATICFIDDTDHKALPGGFFETDLKVVFSVNLKTIKQSAENRADSEVQIDALKILNRHKIFTVSGIEKGVETVFKGFDINHIKLTDMQPYHVFAVVGKLKYKINC